MNLVIRWLNVLLLCFFFFPLQGGIWERPEIELMPVAYKGRIRPSEAYARLWLADIYGEEEIRKEHRQLFHIPNGSALNLLWALQLKGHTAFDHAPLFKISHPALVAALGLKKEIHVSYDVLNKAIYSSRSSNLEFMKLLLPYQFYQHYFSPLNRGKNRQQELQKIAPGLVLELQGDSLVVVQAPRQPPWNFLQPGMVITNLPLIETAIYKEAAEEALKLLVTMHQYAALNTELKDQPWMIDRVIKWQKEGIEAKKIALGIEQQFPLIERLNSAGSLFHLLPSALGGGIWFPLNALKVISFDSQKQQLVPSPNFTLYPDEKFEEIRSHFFALTDAVEQKEETAMAEGLEQLAGTINRNYALLAGQLAIQAAGKVQSYPTKTRLQAEIFYYRIPLTPGILILYTLAGITFVGSYFIWKRPLTIMGIALLGMAFLLHSLLLLLRCYILQRPPVSNMFETIVYVPWITVLASLLLYFRFRLRLLLIASSICAMALLFILRTTALHHELENVQPVLDSEYWLIIHVLLVVGSYGIFALTGILGHIYLIWFVLKKQQSTAMRFLGKCILQAMYVGVAMLIPGTILGGIWAAESWGRFWDWDPKESWAFISSALYLICIHSFRYGYVHYFGLAMGSVFGFLAITFTWYGVNYILGTGLHSYGFGGGGENYYYLFVLAEVLFLVYMSYIWGCFRKIKARGFSIDISQQL